MSARSRSAIVRSRLLGGAISLWLAVGSAAATAEPLRDLTSRDESDISQLIAKMTTEEKIGQLLMVGFRGNSVQLSQAEKLVHDFHVGSIILFERNIEGMREAKPDDTRIAGQVAELTNGLQQIAAGTRLKLPLLVAADQENGSGLVIEKGVTLLPGAMGIAATGNPDNAFQAGEITGRELRAMGVVMNLAPVVDINTNEENDIIGDRAFGASKRIVAQYATKFMEGLRRSGVLSVAKHFPGHGFTDENPHETLPVALYDADEVEELIFPYEQLADQADGIMPAHIVFSELGLERPDIPFSLSRMAIDRWIRVKLGFDGAVVSDDLLMNAARIGAGGVDQAGLMAATAGNDILVFAGVPFVLGDQITPDWAKFEAYLARLAEDYGRGDGPQRLDASVRRVLRLKKRVKERLLAAAWLVVPQAAEASVRTPESRETARRIADESITLVHDGANLFQGGAPLQQLGLNERIVACVPVYSHDDLTPELKRRNRDVEVVTLPYKPDSWNEEVLEAKKAELAQKLSPVPKLLIFGFVTKGHVKLLEHLLEEAIPALPTKPKVLVIAFRAPNLLDDRLIRKTTYLAAYSNLEVSNEAVGRVLAGDVKPNLSKHLPVNITGLHAVRDPIRNPSLPAGEVPAGPTGTQEVEAPAGATGTQQVESPVAPANGPVTRGRPGGEEIVYRLAVIAGILLLPLAIVVVLAKTVFTSASAVRSVILFFVFVLGVTVTATAFDFLSGEELSELVTGLPKALTELVGGGGNADP